MIKLFSLLFLFIFISESSYSQQILDGNSIESHFLLTGVFNRDPISINNPGFEWPKGNAPGANAIQSCGLNIAAKINGTLRMSAASYRGEYAPGFCLNGSATTSSNFRVYKVKRGDNAGNNPDYAEWGNMVPYGAPYVDVNSNGIFELGIDTPGVHSAIQTVFVCLTDGFPISHISNEGFGGGSAPLYSELHMTAWCYEDSSLIDVQFVKWDIINRSGTTWDGALFSLFFNGDIGGASDDFIGCDTNLNLGYTYNADNDDGGGGPGTYGTNPPAAGISFLKTPKKNATEEFGMTSFSLYNTSTSILCEAAAETPLHAYTYMQGLKRDGTSWINPETFKRTKYCFPGDPETNTGWTESDGRILNCGGDTTGTVIPAIPANRRCIMNTGDTTFTMSNNSSVQIVIAQFSNRGTGHLNSATKIKQRALLIQNYWQTIGITTISSEVPESFKLHQNYPNPFNPSTKIKFEVPKLGFVSLKVYDIAGKEVGSLINEELKAGVYEYSFDGTGLGSGVYFYTLESNGVIETRKMVLLK